MGAILIPGVPKLATGGEEEEEIVTDAHDVEVVLQPLPHDLAVTDLVDQGPGYPIWGRFDESVWAVICGQS
jgi:hypothetical protein